MKIDGMRGIFAVLLVFALLQAAAIIGQSWTLASVIANLWGGFGIESQLTLIAGFFGCFAANRLITYVQETMLDKFSVSRAEQLREALLTATFDAKTNVAGAMGSASLTTTATQGIDDVQEYLRIIPPKGVAMAAIAIPVLVAEFLADWPSGIILAVMFPVIMFFMIILGIKARDRARSQYESYNRLSNHFLDTLRGVDAIVASGAVERTGEEVFDSSEDLRTATVRTLTTATLSSVVLDLCAVFGVAAVAILLAFRLMDGTVALQTGLFALILAPEFFAPIRSFSGDFHASQDGKNALAAALEIAQLPPSPGADEPGAAVERQQPAQEDSALSFENVSYEHADSTSPAVESITFAIEPGEHVALVGKSGSGKSTIASLAAGLLQPSNGAVSSRGVRFIPQHPHIFADTLENNLLLYSPEAEAERVSDVLSAVGLDDLVKELPDGLQTMVGEGNHGLSGGQAHRVALARVLLDDSAQVLVFDEPTAHLDIETELELKQCVLPLLEGRAVLFATHRLHWIGSMDRVIELKDGKIERIRTVTEGGDAR